MRRRDFLRTGTVIGVTTAIAGCNTDGEQNQNTSTDGTTPAGTEPGTQTSEDTDDTEEQQTTEDPETAVRYFFQDETGALGHLADDEVPENYDHTITNTKTEQEYHEIQRNDRTFAEDAASNQRAPQGQGLEMTVDEIINRAEEIYNNPEQEFDVPDSFDDINFAEEDDEMTFVRSLIKAADEAGVDSSGLANMVINNLAEDAVDQIQPGFTDFKLSTLPATEAINPAAQGHAGGVQGTEYGDEYGNSGFRHLPGILQYQKNGETEVKYAELTDAIDVTPTFYHVIRDPEDSIYRESLEQETVNTTGGGNGIRFPEHYVTAFDYEKARDLQSQGILGLESNGKGVINGVGDYLGVVLFQLVDDIGITGYDTNPDLDLPNPQVAVDGTIVSDEFGESIEEYVTNPTTEKRQYMENIGRGMHQVQQQEGWGTSLALTGTLEDPEILPTDQETVNQVRQDQAYDQVKERVAG